MGTRICVLYPDPLYMVYRVCGVYGHTHGTRIPWNGHFEETQKWVFSKTRKVQAGLGKFLLFSVHTRACYLGLDSVLCPFRVSNPTIMIPCKAS